MKDELVLKTPKNSFLGVREILSDIKALPKWFKVMLIVGSVVIIFFNFFDIQGGIHGNYFMPINQYQAVLAMNAEKTLYINYSTFGHSEAAAIAVAILYSLNGLAAFTGLLSVAMIVFARPSQYFWGLVNAFIFGLFVLSVGYVGDFFMNVIKFVTAIPGWWLITNIFRKNQLPRKDKCFQASFWIGTILATAFSIMMWLFFIPEAAKWIFNNDAYTFAGPETRAIGNQLVQGMVWGPQHILDGMTAGTEMIGYTFQMVNLGEQFYVWFFVNILKFLKFTDIAPGTLSINMLLQFAVFFSFALVGLYERNLKALLIKWKVIKQKDNKK